MNQTQFYAASWPTRLAKLAACITICLSVSGCDRGPKIVPVNGKVTLDGKPLPFKSVYFFPDRTATPDGNGAGGYTDNESKYYLIANAGGATTDKRGVQPGVYRVTVTEPMVPIDEKSFGTTQLTETNGDAPAAAIVLPTQKVKTSIPAAYSNPAMTPLVITVSDKGGEINLELKSKP